MEGRGIRNRCENNEKVRLKRRKDNKYSPKDINLARLQLTCEHHENDNTKKCQCLDIPMEVLIVAKAKIFTDNIKGSQDARTSSLLVVNNRKRSRLKSETNSKKHTMHSTYTVRSENEKYIVCRKFFEIVFEMSTRRFLWIGKNLQLGKELKENRGGNRYLNCAKVLKRGEKVKLFIGRFKAHENHYSRGKSRRLYLPSTLNIHKMWKMYRSSIEPEYRVSYSYFHKIFSCHFNLGFGTPATDICSYCERVKNKFTFETKAVVKGVLSNALTIHKVKAKQFYLMMKENPENTLNLCSDLQQVHNLPKIPIQETYYSLQIAFYVFCVVNLASNEPSFYTWNEVRSGRGSNGIESAVFHFLNNATILDNVKKIRLFSDGCGGQNKNSHMLHMFMYWLDKHSQQSVKEIEWIFPVRGHSYLPADRIFGRMKKELRRHENIIYPEDYVKLYSKVGCVRELGENWTVYNSKSLLNTFKKLQGISDQKRIYTIKKDDNPKKRQIVLVKTENTYRMSDPSKEYVSLLKRGSTLQSAKLEEDSSLHGITQDKGALCKYSASTSVR